MTRSAGSVWPPTRWPLSNANECSALRHGGGGLAVAKGVSSTKAKVPPPLF